MPPYLVDSVNGTLGRGHIANARRGSRKVSRHLESFCEFKVSEKSPDAVRKYERRSKRRPTAKGLCA